MSPESGRPRRADAARNRESIVKAARAAFEANGVDASLDEIARSAGVGPGTLYRHFPTRDDLVAAALSEHADEVLAAGEELMTDTAPLPALQAWLHALVEFSGTYGGLSDLTVSASTRSGSESLMAICRPLETHNAAFVQAAVKSGDLRSDVTPDDVFVLASAVAWADRYDRDRTRARTRMDAFLRGLEARS